MSEADKPDLTALTVQLLSAYVSNNQVPSNEFPGLIQATLAALSGNIAPEALIEPAFTPATTVRKSLASRDHIISLIDGKPYKSLKRHLSSHGLTPAEYRARYNLPKDYPMVAPAYSEQRREVAQRLGLGRKRREPAAEAEPAASSPGAQPAEVAVEPAPVSKAPRKARAKAVASTAPDGKTASAVESVTPEAEAPSRVPRRRGKAAAKAPGTATKKPGRPKADPSKPVTRRRRGSADAQAIDGTAT